MTRRPRLRRFCACIPAALVSRDSLVGICAFTTTPPRFSIQQIDDGRKVRVEFQKGSLIGCVRIQSPLCHTRPVYLYLHVAHCYQLHPLYTEGL
jgi:hypothetical protein